MSGHRWKDGPVRTAAQLTYSERCQSLPGPDQGPDRRSAEPRPGPPPATCRVAMLLSGPSRSRQAVPSVPWLGNVARRSRRPRLAASMASAPTACRAFTRPMCSLGVCHRSSRSRRRARRSTAADLTPQQARSATGNRTPSIGHRSGPGTGRSSLGPSDSVADFYSFTAMAGAGGRGRCTCTVGRKSTEVTHGRERCELGPGQPSHSR